MVQKYQSPVRVYKYPFELIMAAYERRFPTCPMIPIFIGSDTILETESEDKANYVIERRCRLNVEAPYLLKKIAGVEYVIFIQRNSLERRNRKLSIDAWNESFATRVIVQENCTYFVHPENPDWTCFEQSASLEVKSFFGFENVVEKLAIKQYSANIAKGKEIIEFYLEEMRKEGITYVEPWRDISNKTITGEDSSTNVRSGNEEEIGSGDGDIAESRDDDDHNSDLASSIGDVVSSSPLSLGASASTLKGSNGHLNISRKRSGSGDKTMHLPLIRCDSFPSDGEDKFRLDADYIKRYLGDLSPLEESQLIQLRAWLGHLQKGNTPSDTMLLRFLRADDFNIEKARESLSASLTWRKKHQVDRILSEYEMPQVVKDHHPGGWCSQDIDGRPMYVLRLGMMDVKGLVKSVGEEGLLRLTLHVCEEGLRLIDEATISSGKPVTTWCLLLDLEGLNMRHLWRPGIKALLRIIEIVEANYPETMGRVLIIRAPRVFPVLWTVVRAFIDERTCSKFFFYAGNDYQGPGGLPHYIPKDAIPNFLDGTCDCKIPEGGLVAKSSYMPEELFESLTLSEESIYRSVSLSKGQVHEVVILNEDMGSVITWDFDILRHGVVFTVLRTKHTLPTTTTHHMTVQNNNQASSTTSITKSVQPVVAENYDHHKSVLEKSWKEGEDYFIVDAPANGEPGESVQGSHLTTHTGYYILQWKFQELVPVGSHHLMDSITQSKSKIMYFFEVLKGADYRGSMHSLTSQTSGFSSLSSGKSGKTSNSVANSNDSAGKISSCPSR